MTAGEFRLRAQDRFLGKTDILLFGLGLRVEPVHQVVPRDIATIVSTFLGTSEQPQGSLPPFAPDALVKATLRGPGVGNGLDLTAAPNTPFNIPPLTTAGTYTLDQIRLESGGEVLMRGAPESVTIQVIEKLLVTQVTARALTAEEIREKGIVFDKTNFQAYNFTAAFAVEDTPVNISFPVVLPALKGASDITLQGFSAPGFGATLPELKTIIPDTLRLQTQIPNLQVVGFTLTLDGLPKDTDLVVPPIPGVVVIPGDIGFLNQMFSVMLLVGNVAPENSNLVVDALTGEIHLPAGNDTVAGSDDDPLRMAQTVKGPSPMIQFVVQPGADGKLGTADDVGSIAPGQNGSAEYLVEGRREGTWVVEFHIGGTLHGLPVGPVQVTGRAAGSVLVRNPSFTLTFTHPETVMAREQYSLDVTVTNTSESPANFVSVNLHSRNVTGATVVGEPSRQIDSIPPGESATVSFDLVSRVTGKVTAATLDTDDKVQGVFGLKTAVGELGVPLSPDSLILPPEARALPPPVRNEALSLLGKAWALATAPAVAIPRDVKRLSKQIVFDRAIQTAEAGFRIRLHEPIADSIAQLAMDFIGSDFLRLATLRPNPEELLFAQKDFVAFDELRRRSVRGDTFASVIGAHLAPALAAAGASGFHRAFAERVSYRPPHVSVLVMGNGTLPYTISVVDSAGRRVGRVDGTGKVVKQIPFGDLIPFTDSAGITVGQMIVLAAPDAGEYTVQFDPVPGASPSDAFTASIVVPTAAGGLRQVVYPVLRGNLTADTPFTAADPYRVRLDLPVPPEPAAGSAPPAMDSPILPPPPSVIGVVQQADKDLSGCAGIPLGRIIAVLFSTEVTAASVQDRLPANQITNFTVDDNRVVGVALQPGRRIAFIALRDGVGPYVPRNLTVSGVQDNAGRTMPVEVTPVEMTVDYTAAAVVAGQVIEADGTPVPFADMRFLVWDGDCGPLGVSAKAAGEDGRFTFDWVPRGTAPLTVVGPLNTFHDTWPDRIAAVNPVTDDGRGTNFSIQRRGQRLNINIVFFGHGVLKGRALAEDGTPLPNTVVKATSLTDESSYGATTNELGEFVFPRVPVGNVFLEAVNVARSSKGTAAELIPLDGATVIRDVRLFDLTAPTIVTRYGTVTGHVLKGDGSAPASNVPVIAYYASGSQQRVNCPALQPVECAVGTATTDAAGRFEISQIPAGQIRLATFDRASLEQGQARLTLPADATVDVNVLFSEGLATVNGIVVDGAGTPVAGARVGGGLSLTTTDAGGRFTLTDVPVGRRELVAIDDQTGSRATAEVDIPHPGQTVNVTLVVASVGTISGTVFEANGVSPVPNQKVYLFYQPEGVATIVVAATAVTDAAGRFSFAKMPLRNNYVVSAFRSDFSDGNLKPVALKFTNQVVRADIVFRGGGGTISGRVVDANGTTPLRAAVGISGDRVETAGGLVGVGFRHVANYSIVTTDLATGEFRFNGVFVGPSKVAAAGQFSPDPIGALVEVPASGAAVNVELRLQDTSKIEGIVFGPDGVTPAGRNIIVRYRSAAFKVVCARNTTITLGAIVIPLGECADVPQGIQDETVITDDAGRFVMPLVNAGPFTLTAEDPATGRTGQTAGTIGPGHTGDFAVRLLGVSTVVVRVLGNDTTTPIPGARVEIQQLTYPKKTFDGVADDEGTLVLGGGDGFAEGELTVLATDLRNGFAGRASGAVTTDGETVTINVYLFDASGTVYGTVFKPDGLTPVPNAEVVISNNAGPLAFAVTDATGAYRESVIPLGEVRLQVFEAATARFGFATGRVDFDRQEVPIDISETGRGIVTGTVLAEGTLQPLANWEVILNQLVPGGVRYLPWLRTTTDVDGTFTLPGVTAGELRLHVVKYASVPTDPSGNATVAAVLEREGQQLDLPIVVPVRQRKFGRVEGIVFNPDGTPAADAAVAVCPYESCASASQQLHAVSAADGSFAIADVPIGRFAIRASAQVSASSGSVEGDLLFSGDTVRVSITLVGVSVVRGTVEFSNGAPAPNVQVRLYGQPSSGCAIECSAFADAQGAFTFLNVPARTFWIGAFDPISGLRGSISGTLTAGDDRSVRIVLQSSGVVSGRALTATGMPAAGITVEVVQNTPVNPLRLFAVTGADGQFEISGVPVGVYVVGFEDPLGAGRAQRSIQVVGAVSLGDVTLDEAAPLVAQLTPHPAATAVPLATAVRVLFSERVAAGSVNPANVVLTGPAGPVLGTVQLIEGDTAAVFTPLAPLQQSTHYSVTVRGVSDLIGKVMPVPYTASFTTVDLTPPATIDVSPAAGANGIALSSVVRIRFSEPIDPSKFRGPPVIVTRGGVPVAGRTEYTLGNTTIVFTPAAQLAENTEYQVQVEAATDLAGNEQPLGSSCVFRTLDRTPPAIAALRPARDGTVIENGTTQVVADVGTSHDISVVDFFINGMPSVAARTAPFTLTFQATPALGAPGDSVRISALATDTSGNRGTTAAEVLVPIVADQPPAVVITAPAGGLSARNGDRITVTVRATDDLGLAQIAYRAQTGKPQDAGTRAVAPASLERTETFAFVIPDDAAPGSRISIGASALDIKGQATTAAPVLVTVLDAVAPVITITGTTTGARVGAGQPTTAIVSAQDAGGIQSITLRTGGVLDTTETREVAPARQAVATTFAFTVPASARPGDTLTLDATATDAAGNVGAAARVLLPVADLSPPAVALRTAPGQPALTPGASATLIVTAEDETAVATVALNGQGAFNVSTLRQVTPPSNSAEIAFTVSVPATTPSGAVLNASATATDIFGNVSAPVTLALTVGGSAGVTLPPSLLIAAGDTASIAVSLSAPAPAGGMRVDLSSSNPQMVSVQPSVQFAEGESARTADVSGLTGGTASITASVGGAIGASMGVTVRGGIVSGTVLSPELEPVAGVQVTVRSGAVTRTAVTGADGRYLVEAVGVAFSISAEDPATQLIGFTNGVLTAPGGFAHINVVLVPAGRLHGTVFRADGQTPAGPGVRVEIFTSANLFSPIGSTFTDADGGYEFPLVTLGTYVLEASDTAGNRGRTAATSLLASGQELDLDVVFLGRGTVRGIVRDGAGNPVANAPLTLRTNSIFGPGASVTGNAGHDGRFQFEGVFVGTASIQAQDAANLAGTASGQITHDLHVLTLDVTLTSWGGVQGTAYRADGTTPLANAIVQISATGAFLSAFTDPDGRFAFTFLPLGNYTLEVREPATRGFGRVRGTFAVHGRTITQDISLFPQGTLHVTVTDGHGNPAGPARITISSITADGGDSFELMSNAAGVALIEHVLASNSVTVSAYVNNLGGFVTTTLTAGQVKSITVPLEPTGTIAGRVFLPDGQTPAAGARVNGVVVADDGTYRLENLRVGSRDVTVVDAQNRKRAIRRSVPIVADQVTPVDLTMIGLGTVTGRVLNPDSSSASNVLVTVRGTHPEFSTVSGPRTDAGGFYRVDEFPAAGVQVSAGDTARGLFGEASGVLGGDGETLTVDILLRNNAITLPTARFDGNFFNFDIQRDGSIGFGHNFVFATSEGGASLLDIVRDGTPNRFAGSVNATTENNGREIVVSQNNLAGLNVTRKILVSPGAYFARYLEILTNPTADAITVDVRIAHHVGLNPASLQVLATSSGDLALDVSNPANPDRWVALGTGADGDPFTFNTLNFRPQLAFVFDGAGGARRASAAGPLTYTWRTTTVQPGESVAFMHFAAQQYSYQSARATAERVGQLPPEAIESLSPFEIAAIQNFAVPADGTSALAPLTPLGGTVSGRVFEGDGVTPVVPRTFDPHVRFSSTNVFFGRNYHTRVNATGAFSLGPAGDLVQSLTAVNIPLEGFTADVRHPVTQIVSPTVAGAFPEGASTAAIDVVFSNAGLVRGIVRRHTGTVVAGAVITARSGAFTATYPEVSGNDGGYLARSLPPGPATITAALRHPQTTFSRQVAGAVFSLTGTAAVNVTAGATETAELRIQPTGALTGGVMTALNAPAINILVRLLAVDPNDSTINLETRTDSSGVYRFNDVPPGSYAVQTVEPATGFTNQAQATVHQDQTAVLDLSLRTIGSLEVTVRFNTGAAAQGAVVEIQKAALDQFFRFAGVTDAAGRLVIPDVPSGAFVVRARRPGFLTNLTTDVSGTITTQGQVLPVPVVLPPVGTVHVQVNGVDGQPVSGAPVSSDATTRTSIVQLTSTDANGRATLQNAIGGRTFVVRAARPESAWDYREAFGRIVLEGDAVTVTIVVGAAGTVSGRVTYPNGQPASGASVTLVSSVPLVPVSSTATDALGRYTIAGVPPSRFRVVAQEFNTGSIGAFAGNVTAHDEAVAADIVLDGVRAPFLLNDANGFAYRVGASGTLESPFDSFTEGFRNAFTLRAATAETFNYAFGGDFVLTPEAGGRQFTIQDFGGGFRLPEPRLDGVVVSRKVFVPRDGYFARYLEIFDNPTDSPIAVDASLRSVLNSTRVVATSSGDAAFDVNDRWIAADRPATAGAAAVAHIFAGPGSPQPLWSIQQEPGFVVVAPLQTWRGLVVPAGGRVVLMHFAVQHTDAAAAQAAAERLVQLPPEALSGLTPSEIAAIVNFAVPADGISTLAPFGTVHGTVRASDGTTPVPGAIVTVTPASSPFFKETVAIRSDAEGRYTASVLGVGPFSVHATDPASGLQTAVAQRVIDSPGAMVPEDLAFENTGILTGTLRLGSGAPASCCFVSVSGGTPAVNLTPSIGQGGVYRLSTLPPGIYTVTWNAGSPGIGHPFRIVSAAGIVVTARQTTIADLRLPARATVRVTARTAAGAPLAGRVSISDSSEPGFRHAGLTDANGIALIPGVPEGPFTIQTFTLGFALVAVASGAVTAANDGGIVDVLAQPQAVSISGTVRGGDGVTPVANAPIEVIDVASGALMASTSSAADGTYRFDGIGVAGDFRIVAHSPANHSVTREATRTPAASPVVVDFQLPFYPGSVSGTVFAADGETRVRFAWLELIDASTERTVAWRSSAEDGTYEFANVALQGPAFKLVAHSPTNFDLTVERTGSFGAAPLVIDFVLPIATLQGTMYFADGTPVDGGDVRVTQRDAQGELVRMSATVDGQGRYLLLGLVTGEFSVFARDNSGMLVARASGTLASLTDRTIVDLHAGPSGTVTGTVTTPAGAPAPGARIYLASNGAPYSSLFVQADESGGYTLTRVPVGAFSIQACQTTSDTYVCGATRGTLPEAQTVTADVRLPGFGGVTGTVYAAAGSTPVPNAYVSLVGGQEGPGGWFSMWLRTDADGRFATTTVPAGSVTALAYDGNTFEFLGMNHTIAVAGASVTVDVIPGAVACTQAFSGTDGFRYDADCNGMLARGGTGDGRLKRAYQHMYGVRLNGSSPGNGNAATLELEDRQIAYEPHGLAGVVTSRKIFVPQTGGFARYLETIANPSEAAVTVQVQVEGELGGAVNQIVGPTQTGLTYAVTLADPSTGSDDGGPPEETVRPALAHVFAGTDAAVPADAAHFQRLDGTSYYRWTVTVPAGGSVTLMHFAVQREAADTAGAEAQAQALVNLSDPRALEGLTAAERARIVNFRIP